MPDVRPAQRVNHLIYYIRVPKTASSTMLTVLTACSGCQHGKTPWQYSQIGLWCDQSHNPQHVCRSAFDSVGKPLLQDHGVMLNRSFFANGIGDAELCNQMRGMKRPGWLALHRHYFDLGAACSWRMPPVQYITLLRQASARIRSLYYFLHELCFCRTYNEKNKYVCINMSISAPAGACTNENRPRVSFEDALTLAEAGGPRLASLVNISIA